MKLKYLLVIIILIIMTSCQTSKEIEYQKASTSYEVNDIEAYIKKYPEDENIQQLKFRLRVVEYEKIKKSEDIMLLNYFIKKYKVGKDVEAIKKTVFERKLNYKKNDIEYLTYLKTIFNEEKYISVINEEIYKILEEKYSNIQKIKNKEEKIGIKKFLENYPTSKISSKLRKQLKNYELIETLNSKDLNLINDFIQKNPEYYDDKVKEVINTLVLSQYKNAPLDILKRFLENNKDYKNYKELENTYSQKAYKEHISFYRYERLIELDNKYHNKNYQKEVSWFKNNKEKVVRINNLISSLYSAIPYNIKDEKKLYQIARNTKEESEFIIKSAFFTNDINTILKKVSSHFLIIQISSFKALEYYYNQNVAVRRIELINKYKSLERVKNKYYKEKIILIAFVLDDKKLFFKYLNKLFETQNKILWINYLKYTFLNTGTFNFVNLIFDIASIDFKVVYSDKTLEKNRFDRKINLALMELILNKILANIQKENLIISKDVNRKINTLNHYFKDIDNFKFSLIDYYESKAVRNLQLLMKEIKINPLLKEDIINRSPIVKIKKILEQKDCDDWCRKKDNFYKIFFKNID